MISHNLYSMNLSKKFNKIFPTLTPISIEVTPLTIISLMLVNSLIFYDIIIIIFCICILYTKFLQLLFSLSIGKIKLYIKFFYLYMDMLDMLLEVFESGESTDVDIVIEDDVEPGENTEENIEPNLDTDDPEEGKKPKDVESDKGDGEEGKPNKGKDKADPEDLVSDKGDDKSPDSNEQNPDEGNNSDDDDDDDDVYIADCEKRKHALIKSPKGASPTDKQRILNEYNVLNDMINNIKNDRN